MGRWESMCGGGGWGGGGVALNGDVDKGCLLSRRRCLRHSC